LLLLLRADAGPSGSAAQQPHKKLSKVEELMQKDLQAKQRHATSTAAAAGGGGASSSGRGAVNGSKGRVDHWLYEGIVVKVLSKALKEQGYYKQKVSVC
jgi:DNA/RNA-binding protein KIN17